MSRKCSDQFYYAVRIGRKPGIYRGWYGEYGAKKQITGIRNYDYSTGYLKTSSWEDADAYMRTHELLVVESDFTIKEATSFKEDMSVVYGEARVAAKETPAQPPAAPATENAFFLHLLPLCPIIGTRNWNHSFMRITRTGALPTIRKRPFRRFQGRICSMPSPAAARQPF